MKWFKKNKGFTEISEESKETKANFRDLLDGRVLTRDAVVKQLPFVLFLTFLATGYIANRYHAEKIVRQTIQLRKEVKELRTEKIVIQYELMNNSKRTAVLDSLESKNINLVESISPPVKLKKSGF
ncbi:MAG: hypothetical protein JXR58_12560 [Bacteroidales bacterium]|nr:hypothetical protein [Bacteroidales bacterium]